MENCYEQISKGSGCLLNLPDTILAEGRTGRPDIKDGDEDFDQLLRDSTPRVEVGDDLAGFFTKLRLSSQRRIWAKIEA